MYIFNWYVPDVLSKILKALGILIMIGAFGVFVYMTYEAVVTIKDYKEASSEYDNVSEGCFIDEEEVEKVATQEEIKDMEKEILYSYFPRNNNRNDFPEEVVSFGALREINPEAIGWIVCEELGTNYPIVQTTDNKKYLSKTFEGADNSAGCIFMDYLCKSNLTDNNTFIYGHQMKDGSMFGSLKKLIKSPELLENPIYVYVYTPTGIARYEICSCYVTTKTSNTYYTSPTTEIFNDYKDYVYEKSVFESRIAKAAVRHMITLSTCHGQHGSSQRFVAHASLVDKYYYDIDSIKIQ